ncbi:DUF3905 domain-containing protein [Paenibacillus oryzisoli]|uniref:DUF3905 domain-containing protein n=1 Tax=Paenibacillus oryzisoli TaxID=1850517 RepID=A0A198A8Z7_9BACL|nr:DUF3905 domain-containing protein [Paenibacillus oryzisoli]OAS17428.1 hypothetical protein A8708_21915 [Paenibacillus oryzisoli]
MSKDQKKSTTSKDQSELDPYEIEFLPQFEQGRGPRAPFVNEFGVTIGDHDYESENSPLEQWTSSTNPEDMAGDQWVHPFKDVGFQSAQNREIFEEGVAPQGGIFTHADKNVSSVTAEATTSKKNDEAEA